jgi:hypothetical protein
MEWPEGSKLLDSKFRDPSEEDWWKMEYTSTPGTLVFKVRELVGHVQIDTTQNGKKKLGDWFHISLIWSLGLGLAGLGEIKLYVDGILAPPYEAEGKAVPPYQKQGSQYLDHFTWINNAPDNKLVVGAHYGPQIVGMFNYVRIFERAIPFSHSEILRKTEDPRCGFFSNVCSRPQFERAYLDEVFNTYDSRFRLVPLRPETRHRMRCYPGYTRTDGDEIIECKLGGVWGVPGKTRVAQLMRCCNMSLDFCPPVDISNSPGLVLDHSVGIKMDVCQAPFSAGVDYLPCGAISLPGVSVTYSDQLEFGSKATISCQPGYLPKSDWGYDTSAVCYRGEYDSSVHLTGVVPSMWKNSDLQEAKPLECMGSQNQCPPIAVAHSIVLEATAGRRTGSEATVQCLPGFSGDASFYQSQSVVFTCQHSLGWRTSWGKSITTFACVPDATACPPDLRNQDGDTWAYTGFQGKVEKLTHSYAFKPKANLKGRHMVSALCAGNYNYSFGDDSLVCALAPRFTDASMPAVSEAMHNPTIIWRSRSSSAPHQGGRPAVPLHCRDLSPQIHKAFWHSTKCEGGTEETTKVSGMLTSEGAISMWVLLPDSSEYIVIWSSTNWSLTNPLYVVLAVWIKLHANLHTLTLQR